METKIFNETIKKFIKLKQKKFRKEYNLHIVEGEKNNNELLKRNIYPEFLLFNNKNTSNNNLINSKIFSKLSKETFFELNEHTYNKISDSKTPQNIIGIYKNISYSLSEDFFLKKNNIVLLDNIQDPKNFGSVIRLSVAFEIDAILSFNDCVDIYNPKTVRAAAGLHISIPVFLLKNIDFIHLLKKKYNYTLYTADIKGENIKNIKFNNKKIIIFGNEGKGTSKTIQNITDTFIKIEMKNNVESLNIATAAGIILHYFTL